MFVNGTIPVSTMMMGHLYEKYKDKDGFLYISILKENVFATPIVFPMVAKGKARIRVIPSAAHSKEDLDKGIKAFEKIGKEMQII